MKEMDSRLWVLLGYMGSGKTSVGVELSRVLSAEFVDLDRVIEQVSQQKIADIFERKGELYFRKLEAKVLRDQLKSPQGNRVLSLGGGTPCYGDNLQFIKSATSRSFYLKYSPKFLALRLKEERAQRPLIREVEDDRLVEFIAKHLFERQPFYLQANFVVDSEGKTPSEIVNEILNLTEGMD